MREIALNSLNFKHFSRFRSMDFVFSQIQDYSLGTSELGEQSVKARLYLVSVLALVSGA